MNHVRGVLMLVAAAVAIWRGWKIHTGTHAWMAYGLGVLALALAVWHLTRKGDERRV
jgi:thiol:disulfide interchange protein